MKEKGRWGIGILWLGLFMEFSLYLAPGNVFQFVRIFVCFNPYSLEKCRNVGCLGDVCLWAVSTADCLWGRKMQKPSKLSTN